MRSNDPDSYGQYGKAALLAMDLLSNKEVHPVMAWSTAIARFTTSEPSRKKACPKCAFLGLCEDGYVKDIKPESYTKSKRSKGYAIAAFMLLQKQPKLTADYPKWWMMLMQKTLRKSRKHENELNVVHALWDAGFLQSPKSSHKST